jgi:hypothetical protein
LAFQGWRRFCKEAPVNEQSNTHYRACNAAIIMSKEAEPLDWSKFTHVFLRGLPSSDASWRCIYSQQGIWDSGNTEPPKATKGSECAKPLGETDGSLLNRHDKSPLAWREARRVK